MMRRDYVLISPCRNEAEYLREAVDSVLAQTLRPAKWIIVDDGSTDETPALLASYAERHAFMTIVRREDRGRRSVGPGVIDAFYAGLSSIDVSQFEYLCKHDLDIVLPPRYFQGLVERMEADPELGTCSGKPYFRSAKDERLIPETCGDEMSVGMTKFYRVRCFEEIGGFTRAVMWDGIDCHRCRMEGWSAWSWDDPELRFVHLRPMGSSDKGILTGRMRHGAGQYFMGTNLVWMLASAAHRLFHRPFFIGGCATLWGYLRAMFRRAPRYPDRQFRKFLRRYQWASLFLGKRRAIARIERKRKARRASGRVREAGHEPRSGSPAENA